MNDLPTYLPGILMAYAAFLLAIASPGPNVLAVIGTSMSIGRASGVALAVGVAAGSLCWAVLTVLGLSALLSAYATALIVIKIGGGLYLLWLAYKAFRSAAAAHDIEARELAGGRRTPAGYCLRGFTIQMTNPKAALAWIAIVSLGLQHGAPTWVGVVIVSGTSLLSLIVHLLYALAFSTQTMVRIYSKSRRMIQATLGAFFAFAGIKLLTSRL
ncbi:MAG: LysE family transporter [Agrobacterium sp.]|nr:LysE family transporter [Agrobacterium sp.]